MGNDTSKQHQQAASSSAADNCDLEYLRCRFSSCFDNAELRRLYLSYDYAVQNGSDNDMDGSFLMRACMSQYCSSSSSSSSSSSMDKEGNEQKLLLLRAMEGNVLPHDPFGAQLEHAIMGFRPPLKDVQEANDNEQSRLGRINAYLEGMANGSGRRGARAALATLFHGCVTIMADDTNENEEAHAHPHAAAATDLVDSAGNEIKAPVMEVLNLAYRVALATRLLLMCNNDNEEGTATTATTLDLSSSSLPKQDPAQSEALQALAASCLEFVSQKRMRRSVAVVEDIDDSDLENGVCSKMDFLEWSEATCPMLASILPTFLQTLWGRRPGEATPSLRSFFFPRLKDESAFFDNGDNMTLLFALACISKSLGGSWHRLYTSDADGLSFNRLQNALLGYGGPTLMVIQANPGCIFGAFTCSKWKESKDYYGNEDCFLYQLTPKTAVYRPCGRERNYMYCNSQKRSSHGYKELPRGIGFGGSTERGLRLFLDESFSGCFASCRDATFEPGHLLPRTDAYSQKTYFHMERLEVWGCCGGNEKDDDEEEEEAAAAFLSRQRERSMRAAHIRNAGKVDKAAFLGDLRTGLIENNVFHHVDQIHGSTRYHLLNRTKNGYKYEK